VIAEHIGDEEALVESAPRPLVVYRDEIDALHDTIQVTILVTRAADLRQLRSCLARGGIPPESETQQHAFMPPGQRSTDS
jgi:hypothetical protein